MSRRTGLLLLNLGTPDSPAPADVRRYLAEFLDDPRVIDLPAWRRRLLLRLVILPFRPRRSARAYAKIWTDEGSPLLVHGRALTRKVARRLGPGVPVGLAMRYGEPSIAGALDVLSTAGVDHVVVFPLYPHDSSAATGSSIEAVYREAGARANVPFLSVVPPFFDHPAYIAARAAIARPVIEREQPDLVLFSFHGLPERHVRRADPTGTHCLASPGCCEAIGPANRRCYRAQCLGTARLLAAELGLADEAWVAGFQSRLGRAAWIGPSTESLLEELPGRGVRRLVVVAPAFVADCLETLEELGLRGRAAWLGAGGESFALVPALNASEPWVEAVARIARETSPRLPPADRVVPHAGPLRTPPGQGIAP